MTLAQEKHKKQLEGELEVILAQVTSLRERAEKAGFNITVISRSEAHAIKDVCSVTIKESSVHDK